MSTVTLSEAALTLLRRRVSGERVEVTDETRPAYRELAGAGMMIPLHTFIGGDESAYRFTEEGWLTAPSILAASFAASPAPGR